MSKFKFCRICLDNNVRMHQISGSEVADVYEKITKNQIQYDGKLYFACYICYSQLKNSQQLVIKSQKSEKLLKQISANSPELNLKNFPFLDRLLYGLQNSLIVADIVSLQLPEYDINIKTENQADNGINETCNTSDNDDGGPPSKKQKLDEKYNISQFKNNSIETEERKIISGTQTKTVTNINMSCQLLCDENNKQVLVNNYKKTFINDDCSKSCDSKDLLIKHISGHKPVMVEPDKTYINIHKSKPDGKITVHDHLKEEFKCQYCNYIFVRRNNLKDHIRTHTGEKPYKCQYCIYTCALKSNLKSHIRTHTGDKPYKCQYCSYACTKNSNLKIHINIHTGKKPFKCQYCSYKCTDNSSLKKHIRTHTGEKPFKCQYCSYSCTVNSNLKRHIRTHMGEKPYEHICEICDKKFSSRSAFKEHLQVHIDNKVSNTVCILNYHK